MRSAGSLIANGLCWVLIATHGFAQASDEKAVKVFLLAGQSNMEGKAPTALLNLQALAPATKDLFAHLRTGDAFEVRQDVFIKYLTRHGPLSVGYGSPDRTGVEFEFGHMLGEHFSEPVLLIKAAWGGHSLCKDFRPPSAGLPGAEALAAELAKAQKQVQADNDKNHRNVPLPTYDDIRNQYGASYRNMLSEVVETRTNLGTLFPELKGCKFELAGFVWFQGWNDQYGGQDEYESNLKNLIHDLRRDVSAAHLPIVIAAMGQNGSKPAGGALKMVQAAQMAMNDVPEFGGNVRSIRTDTLVDRAAEDLYPHWKEREKEWQVTGGDHPYHYFGSPIWFTRIGHAMGEAMLLLLPAK